MLRGRRNRSADLFSLGELINMEAIEMRVLH